MQRTNRYFKGDKIKGEGRTYTVLRQLGTGGMAEVYVVTDHSVGREIVLKLLRPDTATAKVAKMFRDEIRILSRLNGVRCKYVPYMIDAGTTDRDEKFYLMEHLHGMSLHEVLSGRAGGLRVYAAMDLAIQLFDGLAVVHESAVIHRDIKPGNVILHREHGEQYIKLIDFGIAKLLEEVVDDESFIGTVTYAAPEQLLGAGRLSPAVDVYAAGMMTFEMLAGVKPLPDFEKPRIQNEDLIARAHEIQRSLADCGDFPPALTRLIDATLASDPKNRPSAEQVADKLRPIKRALPGGSEQRFVTANGVLQDPTQNKQPITRADLDNVTDPDGMDMPWLAELRREHERAEHLGLARPLEVVSESALLPATRVGPPQAPHLDTTPDRGMHLETTQPAPGPPQPPTKAPVRRGPLTPEDRARETTLELPGRPQSVSPAAAPVVARPRRIAPETSPASLPPMTPVPLLEQQRIAQARAKAAKIREVDAGGSNWQQALSSATPPPAAPPQQAHQRSRPQSLVPGAQPLRRTSNVSWKNALLAFLVGFILLGVGGAAFIALARSSSKVAK